MSNKDNKLINEEGLDKVSGGLYNPKKHPDGYYFVLCGKLGGYRYIHDEYGFVTELERDNALDDAVIKAQNKGAKDITIDKGKL